MERDYFQEAQAYIGYTDRQHLGTVTADHMQRFAIAVGDPNPACFEDEFARACGYPGVVAPLNYLSSIFGWGAGPSEDQLREDGTMQSDVAFIPLPGARLMGGGQELEFIQPVRPGDDITLERRLADVERREGRSGVLTLLKTEKRYTNQRNELLLICRETIIAR